jgi:predicted transcriptional regulator
MIARENSADHIPPAELDVLACVWQEAPVTARRIREMMMKYRPMAHGSVVTLLTRLEAKDLVTKVKGPVGKAFLFSPARKPDQIQKIQARQQLNRVFGGNVVNMVRAVIEAKTPTSAEMAEIRKILDGRKRK